MNIDLQAEKIGFALVRMSAYVRRSSLRRRMEELAFELVETVARRDAHAFLALASAIEALIKIGKAIYEIEPYNAEMTIVEIGNIKAEMRQFAELSASPWAGYSAIGGMKAQNLWGSNQGGLKNIANDLDKYRNITELNIERKKVVEAKKEERKVEKADNTATIAIRNPQAGITALSTASDNAAIRQSAIADKIRKLGDKSAQLKDIVAEFPNVSERTLRYDLNRLCAEGVIERIGQGGPGTSYRARIL